MPYYPQQPEEPRQKEPTPRKRSSAKRILLCVSALLILYGSVRLVLYISDLLSSRQTTQELREVIAQTEETVEKAAPAAPATEPTTPIPEEAPTPEPVTAEAQAPSDKLPVMEYPRGFELNKRIRELRKKSEYIIGWITMDDLDEPVVYKDNEFFLNHDPMGKKNGNGAIFLDRETKLVTRPYTLLLYGHNMKTGAMFGNLRKYEDFTYCFQHRMIQFDTLYEEGQYAIFAVATISVTPGSNRYVSMADIQSTSRQLRQKALNKLNNLSLHGVILDVNEEDQLLFLITCVGSDDERLVVAARRLREGERKESLQIKQSEGK